MLSRTLLLVAPGLVMANVAIPPSRVLAVDLGPCTTAEAIALSCYTAIPDFANAPVTVVAGCMCCSGGRWSPDSFDSPVSSCVSELQSAYPGSTSLISEFAGLEGFCSMAGSVRCGGASAATATATGITSSPATAVSASAGAITGSAGCDSAAAVIESCSLSMTNPTFDAANDDQLAGCLCYAGSRWQPNLFDGYVKSCASWAKTADTVEYHSITALTTFCEQVGDIATATSATPISRSTNAATTQSNGGLVSGLTSFTATKTVSTSTTATSANHISGAGRLGAKSGIGGAVAVVLGLYLLL